jgi:hypothetical protein
MTRGLTIKVSINFWGLSTPGAGITSDARLRAACCSAKLRWSKLTLGGAGIGGSTWLWLCEARGDMNPPSPPVFSRILLDCQYKLLLKNHGASNILRNKVELNAQLGKLVDVTILSLFVETQFLLIITGVIFDLNVTVVLEATIEHRFDG